MSTGEPVRTLVIGIGNPLQGDDGLGVRATQMLEGKNLPANVQVEELGTPGWGLLARMEGWPRVVVIDAVQMGMAPGDWKRLSLNEAHLVSGSGAVSLHETGLAECLDLATVLGIMPDEFVLYGVEPARIAPGEDLTPALVQVLPGLVEQIVEDLWKESRYDTDLAHR
jgi:hydrogenase maturation protease